MSQKNSQIMKKLLVSFTILMLATSLTFGENQQTVKEPTVIKMGKTTSRPTDLNPDDNLSCTYVGGKLQFEYATPEGNSNVSVHKLDTGEHLSTQNCNSKFSVSIGETSGFYEIIVNTSEGGTYSGCLSID